MKRINYGHCGDITRGENSDLKGKIFVNKMHKINKLTRILMNKYCGNVKRGKLNRLKITNVLHLIKRLN